MSDPSVVRQIDPIVDDEPMESMDEWIRSCRRTGPPRVLPKPVYEYLEEARAEAR
ncbi:MAG TPA: hypothetical protein VNQ73_12890 [Ilumatobacter sp.]|nr:hypothetical protein [Ilumatobacter sp.]